MLTANLVVHDYADKASLKGEKEWYFFSLKDRKYPTGLRTNRATEAGYWKTTGKDKEIYGAARRNIIGMKKTLVFYKGRAPTGEKSNWIIHEYRLEQSYSHSFKSTRVCNYLSVNLTSCKSRIILINWLINLHAGGMGGVQSISEDSEDDETS